MNIIEQKYQWRGSLAKRNRTSLIVLHHAAAVTCTAEDIHRWHLSNGWSGIGYHYFVRKDGRIYRGRPEDTVGAHAYNSNSISVGVCFEGNFENEQMPDAQFAAGAELVADLMARYRLDSAALRAHREVNATACPGKSFPFEGMIVAAESINALAVKSAAQTKENLVLSFQKAAIADGFAFPRFGADGYWGTECESVAAKCVVKKRAKYLYKNATALVQRLLGITADGKCGAATDKAIRAYQKANKLSVDGAVGRASWKKLLGVK